MSGVNTSFNKIMISSRKNIDLEIYEEQENNDHVVSQE